MTDSPLRSRSSYIPPAGVDPLRPNGDLFFEGDLVRATLPETADVRRGLASAFASAASGHHSGVALKAEAAGDAALEQQAVRQADLADRQAGLYAPRVSSLRDVKSIGDVGSFIAGAAPGVVADTLPAVAAALITRGRGRLAAPSALAGAAVPSYHQQFGEMAREQRLDPTLSEASAEDRLRSARLGAAGGTLLEALLPAKLANSALRRPARGFLNHMRRDAETEGLTETAQTGIQQFAHNTVDPTRGYDGWEMLDAGVAGAAGGAGLAGATRAPSHVVNALLDRTRPVAEPLAPAPVAPAAPGQFEEILNSAKERFGPQVEEAYGTAKDYVSAFAERANEAVKTAQNPGDFVRQVFSPSAEEQAQSILQPEHEDPTVLNAADPAAGLDDRDARNATSAADLASQLMDDPATPQFIRDKIDSMGGDYSSKVNQAYVASTLLGVKGGKKIVDAVGDFVAFSKELAGKAGTVAEDIKTGVTDRVSKKNLQDIHESDVQPLVNLLAKKLGPTGGAQAPQLAKQLVAAANRLSPNGQINEAVDRRLRNFSEAIDDETLDMVTELSGSDALRASIAKIRAIPSAMSDVRQAAGGSFLESMVTNEEARPLMPQIARAVDELALAGAKSSPARESMLNGLAAGVFGSVKNAQTVVEYYGNMRRSAYKLEAEQAKVREDRDAVDPDMLPGESVATLEGADGLQTLGSEFGSLTEQDAKEMDATYRDPNPARPFFRSTDRAELRAARRAAPPGSRVASLREHTAQTGEAPQFVAARLRADLRKRLADSENRDTATVQQAIKDLDTIPEEMRDDSFHTLYKSLKTRKTENRTDLPKLRAQMEAIEKASGVSFKDITAISKRIRRAELADEGGIESDDIVELPKLKKELAKLEAKYAKNADKVLEKFAVVMKPKDETYASDDHVAKFRGILDKLPNALTGTPKERAAKKEAIEKIKKTAIKFTRKGGKTPITLSAESMVYSSQAQGSVSERFFDSVAAMLARPDIEGMVPPAADTLIVRKTGLTWGDIVPEFVENFVPSVWKRAAQRDKENTKAWGKEQRLLADIDTRPKLMAAIRQLQKQYLADQLKLTIAKDEPLSLNDLIERFPAGQRKEMRTAANDAAFEAALGWAKTLSRKNAAATQRNFTDESKQRVLEKYIDEQLEDRYPVEFDSSTADRIAETEQDAGMRADDRNVGADILDAEAELEMMEDRLDAAQGITGLERKYEAVIDQLEKGLDKLIDSVPGPEQRAARAAGAREDAGGPVRETAPANVEEEKRLRREWQAKNPDGAKKPRQPKPGAYMPNEDTSLEDEDNASDIEDSTDRMNEGGPARMVSKKNRMSEDGSFEEPDFSQQNKQTTVGKAKKPPNAKDHAELKKKILGEIRRIRGDEVRLRFNRLIKHIGASGEFSMNEDKTDRLIEIAVNAADPMGVAWHESLHDFFAMLGEDKAGRSIKRDLVNAANAPQVKKRLRELLEAHPEARKQLEESPEERVAYMYQFWAAGDPKLRVGPLGTGTFEKIRAFFRDLFRLVGRHERAQDLMAALHEGKFADTRVVAEVLADMPRDTINNRMERMAPALKDTLDKMVQTAPDRLRDFQNEHISSLADRMEKFIQRRNQRDGEWTNKLAGILDGTTATQRRAALENMQAMKPPSSPLEHKLAKFFKDMHGYMTDAKVKTLDSETKQWVPLREVTNYFPRVFDRAALEKDPDGFVKLLMQHGNMTEASARNTLKALTHGTGQIELAENEHALGFSPYAQAVQDRQLTFIDSSNAHEFAKYQSKDLPDITASYVKQAVHRAEYARDFGNRGEEIAKVVAQSGVTDKKDLENINKIVMGLEGTLGYQMSGQTKELFSGILTLQNLVILPLAIFSQVVDPIVLAARSGDLRDAGNAYVTALKKLTRQADVDGEDIAEMLGIISQDTVLEAMGVAYGTTHMSKRMRNINRVFFKWNGMQGWNNAMRIAATAAGERYLLQNKDNEAALKELGLEPSDIKTKVSFMGKPNAQNKVVGKERLDVSDPKVKEAMFKFVDQAVLRPSAANRPVWMSDPKFLLVAHLKQFTFAMHNVVLKRANAQLDDGNPKPWLILALAMPTILAADMAKFALTGGPPPGWGFKEFLGHAVERSGLLGLGDFGTQATHGVGQGKMPGEALLGPSFEHLMELLRFLLGAPGVDSTDVIDRTVPGARFV